MRVRVCVSVPLDTCRIHTYDGFRVYMIGGHKTHKTGPDSQFLGQEFPSTGGFGFHSIWWI